MYTQYKVVYYEEIGKYFVHAKKPFGLWIQLSKPYKTKRQACIRMNMLALGCDYKTAIRIYNEDIGRL